MRLIDADKLPHYDGTALSASAVARAVENAPRVDAEIVIHARWVKHVSENGATDSFFCSYCDWEKGKTDYYDFNYCPWCGARMDGELSAIDAEPVVRRKDG